MTDVAPYASYCGPGAFAAVTGCTRDDAARALRAVTLRDGWTVDPMYTATSVLAKALIEAGVTLEDWSTKPHGWRLGPVALQSAEDRAELVAVLERVQQLNAEHVGVVTSVEAQILDTVRATRRDRRDRRESCPLAVDQWLARFPRGTWILCVAEHVLVARDGRIVAGDDEHNRYAFHALHNVWRVLSP